MVLGMIAGILLLAAYPPISWGWLAYVALVPFMLALFSRRRWGQVWRLVLLVASIWVGGLFFFMLMMPGVTLVERVGAFLAVFVVFLFHLGLFSHGAWYVYCVNQGKVWALLFFAPLWWLGVEWFVQRLFFGLSLYIGITQWRYPALVGLAEFIGLHGVGSIVVFGNALVAVGVYCLGQWLVKTRRGLVMLPTRLRATFTVTLILIAVSFAWWGAHHTSGIWPTVAANKPAVSKGGQRTALMLNMVQSGFSFSEYEAARVDAVSRTVLFQRLLAVSAEGVVQASQGLQTGEEATLPVTLTLWPETVFHETLLDYPEFRSELKRHQQATGSWLLAGLPFSSFGDSYSSIYNSAVLLNPAGEVTDRYDKVRTIPVAEAWAEPGDGWRPLLVAGIPVGVGLCSELIDPLPSRSLVNGGAQVLVFLSSLDHLGPTTIPSLHAAFAPFRAAEAGRYIALTGSVGVTLVADPHGQVVAQLPGRDGGLLTAKVPLRLGKTWYVRVGDTPYLMAFISGTIVIGSTSRKKRQTKSGRRNKG